jgi:signal transduction histidine kinase
VEVKVAFYRIAQEALNNITKHADPDQVILSLSCLPERFDLIIEDNGQGFDIKQELGSDHFGLKIMYERAKEVGAHLEIESHENQGTRIYLHWIPESGKPPESNDKGK